MDSNDPISGCIEFPSFTPKNGIVFDGVHTWGFFSEKYLS